MLWRQTSQPVVVIQFSRADEDDGREISVEKCTTKHCVTTFDYSNCCVPDLDQGDIGTGLFSILWEVYCIENRQMRNKYHGDGHFRVLVIPILLCIFGGQRLTCVSADDTSTRGDWTTSLPCALRNYPSGSVCVCNVTYCDTLEFAEPVTQGEFVLVSSGRNGDRFRMARGKLVNSTAIKEVRFLPVVMRAGQQRQRRAASRGVRIVVDHDRKFQTVLGFGGAFTGAVSYNLDLMKPELRKSLYTSYYSKTAGIGYNFMRIPIGGCDFDLKPWAYNEEPVNDVKLSNFTRLDDRDLAKVAQIKELIQVTENSDIKFMGAAWSPPRWMKSNNDWSGINRLRPEFYQAWADYHIKYLELMKAAGMDYWAISTGNEPMNAVIGFLFIRFMSLGWIASNQGKWVGENLGPTLSNSAFKDVKLFAGDDQRYTFPWWFNEMDKGHPNATKYLDGLAVHWYWDGITPASLLDKTVEQYPGKLLFNTEASLGDKPFDTHGPILGSWDRAESYIKYILQDLQHSVNGWIDWNLLLNEIGGPNYANNYVETAVVVNSTTGEEFYKQPIFYGLGHFSRFIAEGSTRIETTSSDSSITVVGFERPDGRTTLVFYNKKSSPCDVTIQDATRGTTQLQIAPKSVHSILYA
ncbi:lysosomal acid glucosylceramidase [Uranotaenia lowii]|uniref:lysosomal acid glucosylceramidase n=1 Tax=Uranotaenia lowii TaxID=190385 RepID=UPI0024792703|nr:lysosomal acid glucosylceramidase [Uranotaenia lowii]